jgi:hypothetical protein
VSKKEEISTLITQEYDKVIANQKALLKICMVCQNNDRAAVDACVALSCPTFMSRMQSFDLVKQQEELCSKIMYELSVDDDNAFATPNPSQSSSSLSLPPIPTTTSIFPDHKKDKESFKKPLSKSKKGKNDVKSKKEKNKKINTLDW